MTSLPAMLREAVERHAERPCLLTKSGDGLATQSYREFGEGVERVALGLLAAGLQAGENVILISENCPDWVPTDAGILSCGAVTVPLYPSLPAEQIEPLVDRVHARFAIVEDHKQLAKLDEARERLTRLERIYVFDPRKVPENHPLARPWSELPETGTARAEELRPELEARLAGITPDDVATIIFTPGTTGIPKGAMLTHGNLLSNIEAAQERIDIQSTERMVTFLPLCHVFQRMVAYLGLRAGGAALYNESLRALLPDLLRVRPTVMIVVPRFLEMIRDRVMDGIRAKTGLAGTIATWAMEVASQLSRCDELRQEPSYWLRVQHKLADERVYSAIREQIGLDQLRFMVSGGAALPPDVGRWFLSLGMTVFQGYGLTETSPAVAVSPCHGPRRIETIGPPIAGVEVRIADDGELLCRGPNIMKGYFEMPAETAEAIDAEGWFHTGDIGEWTPEGHLKITDRKKNIIVLANGKNVAPVPIESKLQESPLIARVMLIGDQQNVVTALIVPAFELLKKELQAAGVDVVAGGDNAFVSLPAAQQRIKAELDRLSQGLAAFERVRRFRLLPRDFTLEHGELTPTLKLRRDKIRADFAAEIADMAGDKGE
ncbi:MAG: long-chain fatty acid--CoA ligase [Armatimonadetes bacterium]|nr:long-chain fatty acid--CoA ligase [Armatimonadota bacterium]